MRIVRDRIALVGNVNNPVTLLRRGPQDVRREVFENLDAGVQLIAPECAIPLDTPLANLQEIPKAVRDWRGEPPGQASVSGDR
jgi:[methyl-Co(III) methanol-specific corrinoid protein]:coenzyme M methyltransferase